MNATITPATVAVAAAVAEVTFSEEDFQTIADFLAERVETAATVEVGSKGVRFYSASDRHMSVLVEGTTRYDEAAYVVSLREQGLTMNAVVEATGFSKPKARRLLNEWALTLEVEDAQADAEGTTAAALALAA